MSEQYNVQAGLTGTNLVIEPLASNVAKMTKEMRPYISWETNPKEILNFYILYYIEVFFYLR